MNNMLFHRTRKLMEAQNQFWAVGILREIESVIRVLELELKDAEVPNATVKVGGLNVDEWVTLHGGQIFLDISPKNPIEFPKVVVKRLRFNTVGGGDVVYVAAVHQAFWKLVIQMDTE